MTALLKGERPDWIELRLWQQNLLKTDIAIKKKIEELGTLKDYSRKDVSDRVQEIKKKIIEFGTQIDSLDRITSKVKVQSERSELKNEVQEHKNELEKDRQLLRKTTVELYKNLDKQSREILMGNDELDIKDSEFRKRKKNINAVKEGSLKTTASLTSLLSRMSDQAKLSEESTATLILSSAVLGETEAEFTNLGTYVKSGGKLLRKYGRRKCRTEFCYCA
ncbi:hypothetical protein AB6A40_005981 [Gnathostoma spinigerum]|uniref:Uncharacterized protein n=1 Tax=Gnathostoma spinigerum TaxID=75299 RepID=A0ABD6EJ84_9BILA